MPKCRSCNAEIRWAKTPAGKAMPVDEKPSATGNVCLIERPTGPVAVYLNAEGKAPLPELQPSAEAPRYLSHFATCPNAGLHRKK